MNAEFAKEALAAVKAIQKEAEELWLPPPESIRPRSEMVIPNSYVRGGNLTLWLKSLGPHDRKSTESSNWVVLPLDHAAPVLR